MSEREMLPDQALGHAMAIIGRTGSGKTFAAKGLVERLLAAGKRVCIIDPTGVWWGLRAGAEGKEQGYPVVVFGGEHADVPIAEASGAALAKLLAQQNLPAIVDVSEMTMGARVRLMSDFFDELYRENRRPLTLVLDEADLFAPQRPLPDQTVMLSRVEQIARRGRVRGFRPWFITQRPAELHKSVLSQAATLVALQLTAPQDRDAIGAWIEGQADRDQGKKVLADLPRLGTGEGWVWSPSLDLLQRMRFPRIATFDSSRTPEEGETLPPVALAKVDLSGILDSLASEDDAKPSSRGSVKQAESRKIQELELALSQSRAKMEANQAALRAVGEQLGMLQAAVREALGEAVAEVPNDPPLAKAKEAIASEGQATSAPEAPGEDNSTLSAMERTILVALAQYPEGSSKRALALRTGYTASGGAFNAALGKLKKQDWIEGGAKLLRILPAGKDTLGAYEALPTGKALLGYWMDRLPKAESKLLDVLAYSYPSRLGKVQLASRTGYKANGGSFNAALAHLRGLELVEGKRDLKASAVFFAQT